MGCQKDDPTPLAPQLLVEILVAESHETLDPFAVDAPDHALRDRRHAQIPRPESDLVLYGRGDQRRVEILEHERDLPRQVRGPRTGEGAPAHADLSREAPLLDGGDHGRQRRKQRRFPGAGVAE